MPSVDNTQTINILSLCTGYGGLELGLSRALEGIFRVIAVEVEAYALANLAEKAQEGKLAIEAMWPDLKTFPAKRFRGCFDFILAGYPCQPFSVAGKRQGTDDPRHLWPHIERIIQTVRPIWFFGENVSGHLSIGYPEVYRSLRLMGYKVEAGLFTAEEVGAPHKRERLFILAKSETAKRGWLSEKYSGRGTEEIGRPNGSELGDARSTEPRRLSGCQWQENPTIRETSELADTRHLPRCSEHRQQQKECAKELSGSSQLADTNRKRFQEQRRTKPICSSIPKSEHKDIYGWPSRPGQPQYEWEEPRVVENARCGQQGQCGNALKAASQRTEKARATQYRNPTNRPSGDTSKNSKSTKGQTQPRLGRKSDGTTYPLDVAKGIRGGYLTKPGGEIGHNMVLEAKMRVDRLRLLGNGVIPQQAELAFRTLIKKCQQTK